jgi:hypothetical protein
MAARAAAPFRRGCSLASCAVIVACALNVAVLVHLSAPVGERVLTVVNSVVAPVFESLEEAAASVAFTPLNSGRPTVAFVSGNEAATAVARNSLASLRRTRRPFPVLYVPLDAASAA